MALFRRKLERLLERADVAIDGDRSWDVKVHNPNLFTRVWGQGTLGAGEAYVEGWWDCDRLDELVVRLWRSGVLTELTPLVEAARVLRAHLVNAQKGRRAFEIGRRHYDIGNEFYRRMLDRRMIYSCGYWKEAGDLDQAQEAKLELVARKLRLEPGMRVLDVGCGWGGTLTYLSQRYDIRSVGITVSEQQAALAREVCNGLPIEIRVQDYRDVDETFDRVFSIGMFEHVGPKNYRAYHEMVRRCLAPEGISLLHTIGMNRSSVTIDPWVTKYIFPNSMLPSPCQITKAAEGVLVMEDWHNFGPDYDRTLLAWYRNFTEAWEELSSRYDEPFRRMWSYYLLVSAGTFRARQNQLWQIVYSRDGLMGGYRPEGIR